MESAAHWHGRCSKRGRIPAQVRRRYMLDKCHKPYFSTEVFCVVLCLAHCFVDDKPAQQGGKCCLSYEKILEDAA